MVNVPNKIITMEQSNSKKLLSRKRQRTGLSAQVSGVKETVKTAIDYLYVGGQAPVVLLVRCQLPGENIVRATVWDTPTQELLDTFAFVAKNYKARPFWLDFSTLANGLVSKVEDWVKVNTTPITKEDFLSYTEKYDVELYTTTNLTDMVLRTIVTPSKVTVRYLTPQKYHSEIDVFKHEPISFSNSEHNEIMQGIEHMIKKLEYIQNKIGDKLFGHPKYEQLVHLVAAEPSKKTSI